VQIPAPAEGEAGELFKKYAELTGLKY
jgi:hypothetical protein